MSPTSPKRAIVLGAGPAGLAAALGLVDSRAYDEIHVYQMGWRAGGKCATGRDAGHLRARQNGSHYLFGCYYNAFALIRRAHEILAEKAPNECERFGSFFGDFVARNLLVGAEGYRRLASSPRLDRGLWFRYLPQNMACPGEGGKFCTPFDYALTALQLGLGTLIDIYAAIVSSETDDDRFEGCRIFVNLLPLSPFETSLYAKVLRGVLSPVRFVFNLLARGSFELLRVLAVLWTLLAPVQVTRWVLGALKAGTLIGIDALRSIGRRARDMALKEDKNASNAGQRLVILFELGLAGMTGFLVDELWRAGSFERIDEEDFRAWLARHGASDFARNSSLIRTWYDATISYEDGQEDRPSASAGVTVQAVLRSMFTYKGAFAFQMGAEVGDSFVAPIVRALELSGVKFHFYHRVTRIEVNAKTEQVERIELAQQIEAPPTQVEFMRVAYRVDGRDHERLGWPSVAPRAEPTPGRFPLDSYYSDACHCRLELRREAPATGFDVVVCALPLAVIEDVLVDATEGPLRDVPGPWQTMFRQVRLTESQALRMWFNVPLSGLGWTHEPPILSGTTWPHSTWEDNSQAIAIHNFPEAERPRTIATLFGPLATGARDMRSPDHYDAQSQVTRANALAFLESAMCQLWPHMEDSRVGGVDWSKLIDLDGGVGRARFEFQLVSTNVGPNESYVLAWPGTLRHRMRPDESGYRNLFLAGDWTRNGIEAGTVEGAVMSGIKAARAATGKPLPLMGGDDFDRGTVFS